LISLLRVVLFLFYIAFGWSQSNSPQVPKFENYPEYDVYAGTLAKPKFSASIKARFRREISESYAVETKPNFAGHFVILRWSCGTACLEMAIVDAISGNIYFPPITDEGIGVQSYFLPFLTYPEGGTTGPVIRFKTNSRLLIIQCNYKNEWKGYTYYFLWQQNKWNLLLKERLQKGAQPRWE
jgi:hypothetical protein